MGIRTSLTKSILTLVIVVLLAGSMGGGSLMAASPELPASDQSGTLTIHKFRVEDYENLKESTGSSADAENLPADARALEGITFSLEKLVVAAGADPQLTDPKDPASPPVSKVTDASGEIRFEDLEKGFYLVTETIPDGYSAESGQFIVKIPMDEMDQQGNTTWNYDVHVYPKNAGGLSEQQRILKVVEDERIVVGDADLIPWLVDYPMGDDLKAVVPDRSGGTKTNYATDFYIFDIMDSRLKFESVAFKLLDRNKEIIGGIALTAGADYAEDTTSQADTVFWRFTDSGIKKLADNNVKYIRAHIATRVRPGMMETASEPIWNNARIEFTNASGDPYKHVVFDPEADGYDGENVPKVYFGKIKIDKIETGQPEIKLAGAVFKLAVSEADAKAGNFISRSNDTGEMKELAVTTDETGSAEFSAVGEGTYYLVETEAPEGYKLNETPIEVIVKNEASERFATLQISNDPIDGGGGSGKDGTGGGSSIAKRVKTGDVVRIGGLLLMLAGTAGIMVYAVKNKKKHSKPVIK